jgi:hypothetical protein
VKIASALTPTNAANTTFVNIEKSVQTAVTPVKIFFKEMEQ